MTVSKRKRIALFTRNLVAQGFDTDAAMLAWEMMERDAVKGPHGSVARYVREALDSDITDVHVSVVANDFHFPFEHKAGVANWLDLCEDLQPDVTVFNGDVLDCTSISSFPKPPGTPSLQREIDASRAFLEDWRERCPCGEGIFTEGNHEERIIRLVTNNPGLYDLKALRLPELLGLDELNISWADYMDPVQVENLTVIHGDVVRKHAAYTAKATLLDGGYKHVMVGHVHRFGVYSKNGHALGRQTAWENGCMCDIDQADYIKGTPNWTNCFSVVYQRGLDLQVVPVMLHKDGSFVFEGRIFSQ